MSRRLFKSSVPVPKVLRMPGTPGRWCSASAAGTYSTSSTERFRSLGHPAAGVGGQRLQIPAGAFGIQHPQRQRGFARPGHARNAHDLVQRDVHVDVFQVVYLCPAHEHFVYHYDFPSLWLFCAR